MHRVLSARWDLSSLLGVAVKVNMYEPNFVGRADTVSSLSPV